MNSNLTFVNQEWLLAIFFLAAIVLAFFIFKEWGATRKKIFIFRIFIGSIAISCLALIALKPANLTKAETFEMVLLTDGYAQETLDSLKKKHQHLKIKTYQQGAELFYNETKPSTVFILGQGIAPFDHWQLAQISTHYIAGIPTSGIARLYYQSKLRVGDKLIIKGVYKLPKTGNSLLLSDPSGRILDSITFIDKENDQHYFNLKTKAKIGGRLGYALIEKDSLNKLVHSDYLPIEVVEKKALNILIISSFPTFETKYLKNYLAESGHKVSSRSRLTKGRFKFEYFNTNSQNRPSITSTSLQLFDVLIIDTSSVLNLSGSQVNALESAVYDEGLGVFIQPERRLFLNNSKLLPFTFISNQKKTFKPLGFKENLPKHGYVFKKTALLESIHSDDFAVHTAYASRGDGKIASSVAEQTFQLLLAGNSESYQQFWAAILNAIGKRTIEKSNWEPQQSFGFKDQPFYFKLRTGLEKPLVQNSNGTQVALAQNIDIKTLWHGKTYPRSVGWHTLTSKQDSTQQFSFYAMDTSHYKGIRAHTASFENRRNFNRPKVRASNFTNLKLINPLWFYILFLCCVSYLWLAPKITG